MKGVMWRVDAGDELLMLQERRGMTQKRNRK
jgi:hypothetical protein